MMWPTGVVLPTANCRAQRAVYEPAIRSQDGGVILELLTDVAVERKVVERVRLKAATYGQVRAPSLPVFL